jgi:thymidylate synthase ThyX
MPQEANTTGVEVDQLAVESSVKAAGPMPAEPAAFALARYSRSPDSIEESIAWVRSHDSAKFLDSFYFQYGHGSIADLGHLTLSFERVSEFAAIEIVDEQVWDGQQKSTRYQNFAKGGFVVPAFPGPRERQYRQMAEHLLDTYALVQKEMVRYFEQTLAKPDSMEPAAYKRTVEARAFDVARYLLFLGVPTNVGQVTSIRTLERQMQRLGVAEAAGTAAYCRADARGLQLGAFGSFRWRSGRAIRSRPRLLNIRSRRPCLRSKRCW